MNRATRRREKTKASLMIWLLFLPFLLIGLLLLLMAGWQVSQHLRSLSWQEVPATVLERGVQKEKHLGSDSEKIMGASRISARFAYHWQGENYESERIAFSNVMSRTVGLRDDWKEKLHAAIGQPGDEILVWLDPSNPSDVVALRDLNWLELAIFIILGVLLTWLATLMLSGGVPAQEAAASAAQFSWRVVALMWLIGSFLAVLCPLLWRDGHPLWAMVCALPLGLALIGTYNGLSR